MDRARRNYAHGPHHAMSFRWRSCLTNVTATYSVPEPRCACQLVGRLYMAPSNNLDRACIRRLCGLLLATCILSGTLLRAGETASDIHHVHARPLARSVCSRAAACSLKPQHAFAIDFVVRSDVPSAGLNPVHNIGIRSCRITSCVLVCSYWVPRR